MPGVVGVTLENRECPVNLFEQDDPGEFVGEGHGTERNGRGSSLPCLQREAVGRADGQNQGLRVAVLVVFEKAGELL